MEARSTSCSSSSTCLEYCCRSTPYGDSCVTVGGTHTLGTLWGRVFGVRGGAKATHCLQGLLHQRVLQVGLDVNWRWGRIYFLGGDMT